MANEFPHKHIIGYVHIAPNIEIDKNISATDHSTYCASSIFGIYAKNGRQAIDVCAETGTTYINGVDPVAAYAYTYTAIPVLENIINGKLNNYIKDHDVFHFGGTFTAGTEQGNFGTFSYLKNDSMVIVGTTVKVQNDGWFGNYNVHAGDLLIAYSDSASRNSTTYWDVIETHLGPLNSKGTYTQGNKPNFLTNIYLNDNGDLSYSYSYFTQVHSYVNGGTASDLDSLDNTTNVITTVVSNINFDASGKLSYQLHNLTNAKSHHSQQKNETVEQSVITNLSLSSRGHLTYTASVLSETSSTSGNITVGDANNESFTLIDGIKQSGNGSVSYHYKTITVSYKHHTNEGTATTNLTFGNGGTDSTQIITNVNLSDTGKLTYDYLTLKESQSHHGGSVSANTYNFVDKVELSATGTLSGSTKNTVANSNKIYVTPKNTKGSYYIPFFDGSGTEYKTTYVDSNLYYDPSTNTAYISRIHSDISGDINGDVTGDVTGNTYGNTYGTVFGDTINAFLTTIKQDTDHNSTYYIALVNKTSGSSYTYVDSNDLYFNPNTNILTTGNLNVIGNTTLGDAATDKVTVNGTTNFKQAVDIDSTLNVYRETTLGHLTSTGNTTLTNLHIDGLLDVKTGSSQYAGVESAGIGIHCNVGISGTVGIEGDLIITGNTTFNDGITVNGTANFKDAVDIDKTLNVDGNVSIGGKLTIDDSTKVVNLNADMLDGMHISGIDNKYWGTVTYVKNGDGVMEIGKYIDFHYNKEGETDYSTRIESQNTSTKNTIKLPTNDGTLHVGDFIKSDAGDKELDTTTSSNGLAVLTGLSFDTITGKVSYCTHDIYHGNSGVTAGIYGLDAEKTYTLNNCQFFVPEFTVNAQGHITAASEKLITISPNTEDVASKTHTHTLTPAGSISGSSHKHKLNYGDKTTSSNGGFTPSGTVTSTFTGTDVDNHSHTLTPSGTISNTDGSHSHTYTYIKSIQNTTPSMEFTGTAVGNHTHSVTASGSVASTFTGTAVGNHTHSVTASGSVASTFTGTAVGNHTHSVTASGSVASTFTGTAVTSGGGGAHTHTVSGTVVSNGAHSHSVEGVTTSTGAHTHTVTSNVTISGTESNGVLTISLTNNQVTSSSDGQHMHDVEGEATSAGAHTHTFSGGSAASAGSHTHSVTASGSVASTFTGTGVTSGGGGAHTPTGTISSTFTGTGVTSGGGGAHTPTGTISSTFTGTAVTSGGGGAHTPTGTISGGEHTHNITWQTASTASAGAHGHTFTGKQGTTSKNGGFTPAGTITSTFTGNAVGNHSHTYNTVTSMDNAAPSLTFTGTSAITTSAPSATTTVVKK